MRVKRTFFAYPYIVWMLIFIAAPMLLIVYYAFSADGTISLSNLAQTVTNAAYMKVFLRSIWVAVKATLICLLTGYPVAYILSKMKKNAAALLSVVFIVPMWMNFLLRTYAWQVLLDGRGVINSLLGILGLPAQNLLFTESAVMLGTVYNFLPFMILPIYTVLLKLDKSLIEAAADLGANPALTFIKVTLPQSIPGIITGITMVFIPAITTFAISGLLGGGKFMMFGELIENQFITLQNMNTGSALSFILLVLVLVSMFIMRRADHEAGQDGGRMW